MPPRRTTCPFCAHSFEPNRIDILPPQEFLLGYEVMWLKPFGSNRRDAYDRSDGGEFLSRRHRIKELVRNEKALDDLIVFQYDLESIGRSLCEGKEWREIKHDY